MTPRLAVVTLWAEDVPTTAHFYRDVIGLPLSIHGHAPHFDLGGSLLAIMQGKPGVAQDTVPARFPLLAIAVDDLTSSVERLEAHGVSLPWGQESGNGAHWVMFHDPAGNLIELVQFD